MKIHRSLSQLAIWLIAAMLVGLFPAFASAEDGSSSLSLSVTPDITVAELGDNITFTCLITNTGDSAVDNLTATADRPGDIALGASSLGTGENITALSIYTIQSSDYPGPLVITLTVTATAPNGAVVEVSSQSAPVTLGNQPDDEPMTKAEILKLSGVPGKGIDKAPGLQKPFNDNSQAAEHAGKKDKDKQKGQDK